MSKIAYYLEWNDGPSSGVFKKVIAQTRYWAENGETVHFFVLSHNPNLEDWQAAVHPAIKVTLIHWKTRLGRFGQMAKIVRQMMAWQPDLVYSRFGPYYPFFELIWRRTKLILEINTDDMHEYKLMSKHRYWYTRLTRPRLMNKASGFVFVSREVSEKPHYRDYHKPFVVIANGIDLSLFSPLPAPQNTTPRLIFIGIHRPWHGTDKILLMARHFPDWHFDLVGVTANGFSETVPSNVHLHGVMERVDYEGLVAQADVGIGSLALNRVGIRENSPLKLPEYMAYGLPAIVGYQETNFPQEVDFLLQLPSTDDNVATHLDDIEAFVMRSMGKRVAREAIQHVDAKFKEQERLAFFRKIMAQVD